TQPQPVQPSTSIAVFQILTFLMGNIFSMVVGILSLIFYNDMTVKDYFSRLNRAPAASPTPVNVEPQPTPLIEHVIESIPAPVEESITAEKPKRAKKSTSK
ncbi:MAG: hypothetical protein J0M11_23260, partial [Anaerolineae bacterium]|nr:hypothetical protein [Anaerolineae bacterium]